MLNFSLGVLEQGLHDRAITRDLEWGMPIPVEGLRGQAHLRLVRERHRLPLRRDGVGGANGPAGAWRDFWQDPASKTYYFIGKDNIWFHTLSWPAQLMGYSEATGEQYNLPYDVPANQYLTIRGSKASTSRRMAVWVPDFLSRYDPDPLRYYLSATMPETSDSEFTWTDFVRRNNDELVATWGNLVNRVLTFTYRNFDRAVPKPAALTDDDRSLTREREARDRRDRREHRALPLPRRPRLRDVRRARGEPLHRRERPLEAPQRGPQALRDSAPHRDRRDQRASTWRSRPTCPSPARGSTAISATKGRFRPPAGSSRPRRRPARWRTRNRSSRNSTRRSSKKKREGSASDVLIDSHCHLQDPKFDRDRAAVIQRARAAGVSTIVVIGYDMTAAAARVDIAESNEGIFATIGVHPHDAKTLTSGDISIRSPTLAESPKSRRYRRDRPRLLPQPLAPRRTAPRLSASSSHSPASSHCRSSSTPEKPMRRRSRSSASTPKRSPNDGRRTGRSASCTASPVISRSLSDTSISAS